MRKRTFYLSLMLMILLSLVSACNYNNNKNKNTANNNELTEFPFITMSSDGLFKANEEITWREGLKMFELNYKGIYDYDAAKLDQPIIRGEFMDYMSKAFNYSQEVTAIMQPVEYKDIAGHQYRDAIDRMSAAGLCKESEDGMFYPDSYMTRIEVVTFLANIADRSRTWKDTGKSFKDVTEDSEYYEIVMNALCGK